MQAPYKEQKASNAVHLPPYWNVLSFSFIIIECSLDISFRVVMQHTSIVYFLQVASLDISFRVAMQHTSPLEKGRKRRDYLYRTDVYFKSERGCNSKKLLQNRQEMRLQQQVNLFCYRYFLYQTHVLLLSLHPN